MSTRLFRVELRRSARHLTLPEMGRERQELLRHSRVLRTGSGATASPLALHLDAAEVGTRGLPVL